jgi:hypothetical protein
MGLPHLEHIGPRGGCSKPHRFCWHFTINLAPHCWLWSPKNEVFPQAGQVTVRLWPQWEQVFHPSLIGDRHLGQRSSSTGFHLPHMGQELESGGTSSPQ